MSTTLAYLASLLASILQRFERVGYLGLYSLSSSTETALLSDFLEMVHQALFSYTNCHSDMAPRSRIEVEAQVLAYYYTGSIYLSS